MAELQRLVELKSQSLADLENSLQRARVASADRSEEAPWKSPSTLRRRQRRAPARRALGTSLEAAHRRPSPIPGVPPSKPARLATSDVEVKPAEPVARTVEPKPAEAKQRVPPVAERQSRSSCQKLQGGVHHHRQSEEPGFSKSC
ncbi:MAG: hypothetical protein V5B38_21895 [Candidatus Accumulibacter propinquus]